MRVLLPCTAAEGPIVNNRRMPHHTPVYVAAQIAYYPGDGSERCLICRWRSAPSWYVGRVGVVTDDGLPERYPACSEEHGKQIADELWPF